jgi:hypothetical protein
MHCFMQMPVGPAFGDALVAYYDAIVSHQTWFGRYDSPVLQRRRKVLCKLLVCMNQTSTMLRDCDRAIECI